MEGAVHRRLIWSFLSRQPEARSSVVRSDEHPDNYQAGGLRLDPLSLISIHRSCLVSTSQGSRLAHTVEPKPLAEATFASRTHNCSDKTPGPCPPVWLFPRRLLARPGHPLPVWFGSVLGSHSPVHPRPWCHLDPELGIAVVGSHRGRQLLLASGMGKSQGWQMTITFKGRNSWSPNFCVYVYQSKKK